MCEMSLIYGHILTGYFHLYLTVMVKRLDLWNVAVKGLGNTACTRVSITYIRNLTLKLKGCLIGLEQTYQRF